MKSWMNAYKELTNFDRVSWILLISYLPKSICKFLNELSSHLYSTPRLWDENWRSTLLLLENLYVHLNGWFNIHAEIHFSRKVKRMFLILWSFTDESILQTTCELAYCAKHSLFLALSIFPRLLALNVTCRNMIGFAYTLNTTVTGKNVLSLAFAHSQKLNIILRRKAWSLFPTYPFYEYCSSMPVYRARSILLLIT